MLKAATPEAYRLIHEGALALADAEAHGMRIDLEYLDSAIDRTSKDIRELEGTLRDDIIYAKWKRRYGSKAKLGSKEQLGEMIFGELGYHRKAVAVLDDFSVEEKKPRSKNDEAAFEHVDIPFVKQYFRWQKKLKARDTYLLNIKRETVDGYLHPFFNLHTVRTYRSSSDSPNFQNFPVRDKEIGELIRRCFIAPDGFYLVENDFGGIEVRIIACYSKDPVLIDYVKDKDKDMHRDMASLCYKLKLDQVTKESRYCGKNMFVFPEFYGSYYIDCARNLWEACEKLKLTTAKGEPLRAYLARKGITELGALDPREKPRKGTFERHIQAVEEGFWEQFAVHAKWKRDWWERYQRQGYIETLTGFILQEVYRRNQVGNSPVQGSAFHITLRSLTLLNKILKKRKMKSRVVGQIHDSIIGYAHKREKDDYLQLVKEITTVRVPEEWKWIIVPLEIEAEVAPLGGSWHDKKQVKDF